MERVDNTNQQEEGLVFGWQLQSYEKEEPSKTLMSWATGTGVWSCKDRKENDRLEGKEGPAYWENGDLQTCLQASYI